MNLLTTKAMKDLIGTLAIMLLCVITALAQDRPSENTIILPKPKPSKAGKLKRAPVAELNNTLHFTSPISLQVLAGSQGLGADIKYGFLPKLSGRVGFGIIPVDASKAFRFSSFPVQGNLSSRFSNVHLMADYSPFKTKNFRIVGGAAYLIQGDANFIVSPAEAYTIGSRTIKKEDVGVINADVRWKGVAPYLGASFLRSFPNKLFNVNLDLGTYYLSRPGTSFTGTKMLTDNEANTKQFNENMKSYRWMPVVQLNFNFRLK
jgi:hypothetical protein